MRGRSLESLQNFACLLALGAALASGLASAEEFPPCDPVSEFVQEVPRAHRAPNVATLGEVLPVDLGFCSDWNPEFANNSHRCCGNFVRSRSRRANLCAAHRRKATYCEEITDQQREYTAMVREGRAGDVLDLIRREMSARPEQSFCGVNNGFLAWGRRLVPTTRNRIRIRRPDRCVDFGTDSMVGVLEWLGRKVADQYPEKPGIELVIGDISAPRGGCLSGMGGRRGHKSHTNGTDVDLAYLWVKGGRSPEGFFRDFDPQANWWLLKQAFANPMGCVKVVFLDRRHIRRLAKAAKNDPQWGELQRHIRHVRGHYDHFHIRVGQRPGAPGCPLDGIDTEDEAEDPDLIEAMRAGESGA